MATKRSSGFKDPQRSAALKGNNNASKGGRAALAGGILASTPSFIKAASAAKSAGTAASVAKMGFSTMFVQGPLAPIVGGAATLAGTAASSIANSVAKSRMKDGALAFGVGALASYGAYKGYKAFQNRKKK